MNLRSDIDYWRVREAEERIASVTCGCVEAADCHRVMAERYADRIWSAEEVAYARGVVSRAAG